MNHCIFYTFSLILGKSIPYWKIVVLTQFRLLFLKGQCRFALKVQTWLHNIDQIVTWGILSILPHAHHYAQ